LGRRLLWPGYAAGLVNVLLQAVMLLLALLSLAAGHDQAPLTVAQTTAPLGIFLLLVSSVLAVLEQIVIHYAEHGLPE
jgi:predicted anti-sigma-YlaC factor YlaD